METLSDLFEEQIKDLYSAETQLVRALPRMIKAASSKELVGALTDHLEQTRTQVQRLETIAERGGFKAKGKVCHGMKGLLEEGVEATEEQGNELVIDGAIIAAAQRVEHYEISGYGTARALAKRLGQMDFAKMLEETLREEEQADALLTKTAENVVYRNAPVSDSETGDKEDMEHGGKEGKKEEKEGKGKMATAKRAGH